VKHLVECLQCGHSARPGPHYHYLVRGDKGLGLYIHVTFRPVLEFQHYLGHREEESLERKSDIRVIQDNSFGRINSSQFDHTWFGFNRSDYLHTCSL
jgi:hypothetical protein